MKRTAILMMALVLCLSSNCLAESILPSLSEPETEEVLEAVTMPSLEQVSWYDHYSVIKCDDGRLLYSYRSVSENAYKRLGVAMAEAGYTLKDSSTEENGDLHFLVGTDAVDMELVYHGVGGDMDIYYPENAVLEERNEESLTIHLQLGDPFRKTEELTYFLVSAHPVDEYDLEYTTGAVVRFSESRTVTSSETCQYIVLGYTMENQAIYKIEGEDNKFYYGFVENDGGILHTTNHDGGSNEGFSRINRDSTAWVDGESTRYYAKSLSYDPTILEGPLSFTVSFISDDKLTKYSYDVTIGD